MKAVWSFWSKPYFSGRKSYWASEKHHWLSWVLSLETARRHYSETCLYTDKLGSELLVDRLGLRFSSVSTALEDLVEADPGWWALGKIYTYSLQQEPFVHIDSDVYLWKRLPAHLESADVFAQNPEPFHQVDAWIYQPERVEQGFEVAGGWFPEEWRWFRQMGSSRRGECCGILGGRRADFIRHCAQQSLRFALHPENAEAWRLVDDKPGHMVLLEQYLLAACVDFHQASSDSPFQSVQIRYLFDSPGQAFRPETATSVGYTHLIAESKRSPVIAARLEHRVGTDYPEYYKRCLEVGNQVLPELKP